MLIETESGRREKKLKRDFANKDKKQKVANY